MLKEALRYLGIQGEADRDTVRLVSECMETVKWAASPSFVSRTFSVEEFMPYILGDDIKHHLAGTKAVFVFAATLGHGVDLAIRKAQAVDMARAAGIDACAAAYIENYCDSIMPCGLPPNRRFSPGYGDYPLSVQPKLLKAIDAGKIGVSTLDSFMLLPTKSVTAIVGMKESEV